MAYHGYYPHGSASGRSLANGATSQWGYDGAQRLSAVIHGMAGTGHDAAWTYAYNPASQVRSVTRDNDAYAWTRHYAVARAYTTNGLNQYSGTNSSTGSGPASAAYHYDANGNLIADGTWEYAFDIENRLTERSGGTVLTYDPLGRLFRVTTITGATTFLYDGDALVAEYDTAGEMTRRYVHNVGADVPLLSYEGATLGLPSYLHADHQGSIAAVSDPWGAGSVNTYDEYGIPGAANVGRFQYTGQIWLPELGMYYYKARVYSPTLGRFLQTDPVGYDDQFNLYAYVANDPINQSDPSGRERCAGTPKQCEAYSVALNFAEQASRSPNLSRSDRGELSSVVRDIRANNDYIILFTSKENIDSVLSGRGFAYTDKTRRGTIFTVLPDDFPTLFDSYRQLGRNPEAERGAVVAHDGSHHQDFRRGTIQRGDPFSRTSPTERKADRVQGSVIRGAPRICTGSRICPRGTP